MTITNGESEPSPYPAARAYTGPSITVYYDRDRCVHFAECVRGLPGVFDVNRKPWIDPTKAGPRIIANVIERCPSGALHYEMTGRTEKPASPTEIRETELHQIQLRGDLSLRDPGGGEVLRDTRITVCGCGKSERRPLCDGACEHGV